MAENDDYVIPSERPICPGCNQEIDPDWCWCGGPIDHSPWEGHMPVPMGCICGYD